MEVDEVSRAGWRWRWARALDRAEAAYLRVLRAAVLLVATALVALAIWLAVSGIFKMSRSPDSVIEQEASVAATDLTDGPIGTEREPSLNDGGELVPSAATRNAYQARLNRYFDIYRNRFEPYRQADDKQLSRDEFDDQYLRTGERAMSVAKGQLDETQDLSDLDRLITVMNEAALDAKTVGLLQKYKGARKIDVRKTVDKVRTEVRRGWYSGSMACSDWYLRPYGCPTVRSVAVPYSETVTVKEFPKGTLSHSAIFDAYHRRYLGLLDERRTQNRMEAEAERQSILDGKIEGGASLWSAVQLAGAFLALMFFFLLVAIERHQRKLSGE